MHLRNINNLVGTELEYYKDDRGSILDLFYNANINHVAQIISEPGIVRGNHYHKKTTQHTLITEGTIEYWYKDITSDEPAKVVFAKVGDIVTSKPYEIHSLKMGPQGSTCLVFTQGPRGGKDYESDTFRVDNIVGSYINEL